MVKDLLPIGLDLVTRTKLKYDFSKRSIQLKQAFARESVSRACQATTPGSNSLALTDLNEKVLAKVNRRGMEDDRKDAKRGKLRVNTLKNNT